MKVGIRGGGRDRVDVDSVRVGDAAVRGEALRRSARAPRSSPRDGSGRATAPRRTSSGRLATSRGSTRTGAPRGGGPPQPGSSAPFHIPMPPRGRIGGQRPDDLPEHDVGARARRSGAEVAEADPRARASRQRGLVPGLGLGDRSDVHGTENGPTLNMVTPARTTSSRRVTAGGVVAPSGGGFESAIGKLGCPSRRKVPPASYARHDRHRRRPRLRLPDQHPGYDEPRCEHRDPTVQQVVPVPVPALPPSLLRVGERGFALYTVRRRPCKPGAPKSMKRLLPAGYGFRRSPYAPPATTRPDS